MHYEVFAPKGNPRADVTLVNGFTRSGSDLRAMARTLMEKEFRAWVPDNRGSGKTPDSGPFTLDDIASDLVAMWDANGVR